jgi:hypothetical protein
VRGAKQPGLRNRADGTTIRFESVQYESIVIAEPFGTSLCHELPPEALEHSSLALRT